jgi:hypothetical protein
MKFTARFFIILVVITSMPFVVTASDEIDLNQTAISVQVDKKTFIAGQLQLTDEEGRAFWPIYDNFQAALSKSASRSLRLIKRYAKDYETMTNDTAAPLLTEFLDIQVEKAKIKQTFAEQFSKALSAKKVVRYFQIENKMEAGIRAKLAARIPLMK